MNKHATQEFIDTIVQKSTVEVLDKDILSFLEIISQKDKEIKKLKKENNFFLKKWDKRNILLDERDAKKDKIIEQQSRLAAMGEMIDAVAHQWKQPLNAISMLIDMLKSDFDTGDVDKEYIDELEETTHLQINHMVTTLNEFRNFLRPTTKNELFFIHSMLANVLVLMKDELISQNIHFNTQLDHTVSIFGNKNEFKHLILNLINNSIDAFNEKKIHTRKIFINAYTEGKYVYMELEDNAGGIPDDVIQDVFKANVTTKEEGKGTGIGLYMSEQIVKKNNGSINVHNSKKGAFFTIILPYTHN